MRLFKTILLFSLVIFYSCKKTENTPSGNTGKKLLSIQSINWGIGSWYSSVYLFEYDSYERLTRVGFKSGLNNSVTDYIAYEYNAAEKLPKRSTGYVEYSNGYEMHYRYFTYDAQNRLVKDSQYISPSTLIGTPRTYLYKYSYSQQSIMVDGIDAAGNPFSNVYQHQKDSRGNIVSEKNTLMMYPNDFTLLEAEYDNKPNPLFGILPAIYPHYHHPESPITIIGRLSTQKNNLKKLTEKNFMYGSWGYDNVHQYELEYNNNGSVASIIYTEPPSGMYKTKYVFNYED